MEMVPNFDLRHFEVRETSAFNNTKIREVQTLSALFLLYTSTIEQLESNFNKNVI